jgi:MtfA peptidase
MPWWELSKRLTHWREQRALDRRPIDGGLWQRTLRRYPFLRRRDPALEEQLLRLTRLFLDRKEFTAIGQVRLNNDVVVAIAAQACLPVLRLGLARYDGFVGIVVHESAVRARRTHADETGVVHEYDEVLSGEAVQGGPVMLSWRDVRSAGLTAKQGFNVVIHEFAHVLDMEAGPADGAPLLPGHLPASEWQTTFQQAFDAFVQHVHSGQPTWLDPYGAEGPEEFFAVASEAFFVRPTGMKKEHLALYQVLCRFYLQDPVAEGYFSDD